MEILHKFVTFMALPFRVLSLTLISPIELPLCVWCVFWAHNSFRGPFTPSLCSRCLHCYFHELSSICATKYSTKQSTKIHSFPQCVQCNAFLFKFTWFWWFFFSWNSAFIFLFGIFAWPKRCLKQVLSQWCEPHVLKSGKLWAAHTNFNYKIIVCPFKCLHTMAAL